MLAFCIVQNVLLDLVKMDVGGRDKVKMCR